jgi:glutamyl-tRNA synthetase
MKPIVRFAPSPTGELHIGGARVALFNYLFAKKYNGQFLLRIEDTDFQRSQSQYKNQICKSLKWLGLHWDKDTFIQTENLSRHKETINQLLSTGKAYKCFATKEELELIRKQTKSYRYPGLWRDRSDKDVSLEENKATPFSVRLKTPRKGRTSFLDMVYGEINVENSEIDDFILARSDVNRSPVYNLVVTVDDHDMCISHVIRGEDHISNTVKQILLFQSLGWSVPQYAHLPMILGSNGERLSKRHGATGVQTYQEMGYESEGLLNYLAFLGWNPATEEEIMKLDMLIEKFNLDQVQKKGATFDEKKLDWISGQHLSIQPAKQVLENIKKINAEWGSSHHEKYVLSVISLLKTRMSSTLQLIDGSSYFFDDLTSYDQGSINKFWKKNTSSLVDSYKKVIIKIKVWDSSNLEELTQNYMKQYDIGFGKLMKPIRFILCGVLNGPPLFDIMELLGKDVFIKRVENAIEVIQ